VICAGSQGTRSAPPTHATRQGSKEAPSTAGALSPRRQSVAIAADVRIKPLRASRSPPSAHVMPCRQPAMGARETGCFAHGRCGCVRVGWLSYLHHERQRPKRLCYLPTHAARCCPRGSRVYRPFLPHRRWMLAARGAVRCQSLALYGRVCSASLGQPHSPLVSSLHRRPSPAR